MRLPLLIILSLFVVACLSDDCLWQGKLTSSWGNVENWSCNKVPGTNDAVLFKKNAIVSLSSPKIVRSIFIGYGANVQLDNALTVIDSYHPTVPIPTLFKNKGIFQVGGNLEITLQTTEDDTIASSLMFGNDGELYVQGSLLISVQPSNSFTFNFYNLVENHGLLCVDNELSISVHTDNSFINSNQFNNNGAISAGFVHVYFKALQSTVTNKFVQFFSKRLITRYINITYDGSDNNLITNDGKTEYNQITQFESTSEFTSCGKNSNKLNFKLFPDRKSSAKQLKLTGSFNSSLPDTKSAFKIFPGFGEILPKRNRVKCKVYKCVAPQISSRKNSKLVKTSANFRSVTESPKRLVGLVVVPI